MSKKTCFFAIGLAFALGLAGLAAEDATTKVVLNGVAHTIWTGKGAADSTIVTDSAEAPAEGISSFALAATFTRAAALKTFALTLGFSDTFAPSGEIALFFPARDPLHLYGKVTEKRGAKGGVEYALSFFAGLSELRDCCALGRGGANLAVYSQDSRRREIALPGALFEIMPAVVPR